MVPEKYVQSEKQALTILHDHFTKQGINSTLVLNTRVPILKVTSKKPHNLKFDLCVNRPLGIKNSQLIHAYLKLDPRMAPLIFALKKWNASVKDKFITNEAILLADGSINLDHIPTQALTSYCLTLMLIHFLQTREPPILPNLQKNATDPLHFDEEMKWKSENKDSTGKLLIDFFDYYASFNFDEYAVSIRVGAPLKKQDCKCKHYQVIVEDPFELGNSLFITHSLQISIQQDM